METIVTAVVGAIATIVAAWITNRRAQSVEHAESLKVIDPITRSAAIVSVGLGLTIIAILTVIAFGPLSRIEVVSKSEVRTLADFASSLAEIEPIERMRLLDADAKAILDGAGPKDRKVIGRNWAKGNVVYVNKFERIEQVFPHGSREKFEDSDRCNLKLRGKLTVRGFSVKRKSVLVEYTPPSGDGRGTSCNVGTYFFYRIE